MNTKKPKTIEEMSLDELRQEIMFGVEQIRNGEYVEVKASELDNFAENLIREASEKRTKRQAK